MKTDFYVIGIGVSAGGVDALKKFFSHIDPENNSAFVIVQHLARSQKGFLKNTLSKVTSIPVTEVNKRIKIEANHIYIIPPQFFLLLSDGHLTIKERSSEKINNAIDIFMETLADKLEEKAIGIIMSGMGTDGSKGVQRIKERGGMVMVQNPGSASFSNMPLGAIISDHPDFIGSVEEIAKNLEEYIKSPTVIKKDKNADKSANDRETIQKILSQVIQFSGVNFRDYKLNTILRRIDKRIKINHLYSLEEYADYLSNTPEEVKILFNDLLIGVTEFFRDEEVFKTLREKIIPEICSNAQGEFQTLRLWVAACSTGEEAYTIAILLDDYIQKNKLPLDFKLFATDLNPKAIAIAGRGQYTEQIDSEVPSELIHNYFNKKGDYYEIKKEIRKKIIFSVHNILIDPPFIRLNFISCRNLFIYLKEDVQKKLLYTFNYSLHNQGFLMLGANETDGDLTDVFERLESKAKIYRNKVSSKRFRPNYINSFEYPKITLPDYTTPHKIKTQVNLEQESYAELLVNKYAPDCIIVSETNEVIYSSGNIEKYIRFPNNRANLDIFDMVTGSVSLAIRNGLRNVRESKTDVVLKHVMGFTENPEMVIDLHFYLKNNKGNVTNPIIIEFAGSDNVNKENKPIELPSKDLIKEIERLEVELHQSRKELQYNSDELEAINEELQSSNEEMKSSNEEMQTTNEELQSTNEELKTVNLELQHKIDEITILHDDVNNLFISTRIATIFLDKDLKIRKYTPSVQRYFNIRESDIGRPINHYTYNFEYEDIKKDLNKVLNSLQPIKKEIAEKEGFSTLKILPYKTDDMRIEGVIMTFTDVTDLKDANLKLSHSAEDLKKRTSELEQSEKYWKSLVENSPDIIARLDDNGKILFINESITSYVKKNPEELIHCTFPVVFQNEPIETKIFHQKINEVFKTRNATNFYHSCTLKGKVKHFYITLIPEWDLQNNDMVSVLLIARDMSDLREAENRLEKKSRRLEELNQYMDNFVHAVAHDLRSPITNLKLILELLEEENDNQKRNVFIKKFGNSVSRMDEILNGLIEIVDSQVETDEKEKQIEFRPFVSKVIDQVCQDEPKPQIEFDFKVPEIKYVRGYLFSILRNLISNSIKYQSPKRKLKLKISSQLFENYVLIKITDNGIGMDSEQTQNSLFKPFKRFNEKIDGKGIGLHIIKSMIEKTGGKIEVESEPDKGTTFKVFLLHHY